MKVFSADLTYLSFYVFSILGIIIYIKDINLKNYNVIKY